MNEHIFSRRALLRGAGVTWRSPGWSRCESGATLPEQIKLPAQAPVRLAVLFAGNGFHSREWWARQRAEAWSSARCSAPLAEFREKMLFIRGLYNAEALKGNIHSSQTGNLLSGAPLASGGEIRSGMSFDQLLARTHGRSTKVPSLVLGCGSPIRRCTRTIRCSIARTSRGLRPRRRHRWSSILRWRSTASFGTNKSAATRAFSTRFSPTLAISAARSAQRPAPARRISGFRARDRTTDRKGCRAGELQGFRPTLEKPNIPRPADGIPQDIGEHMRLMCDILVLGFQTDSTRICTLKLNNDHSSLRFPNLGVDYMIHHLLSHSDTADWLKVNQFFLKHVAYIAQKLDAIREGDRSALDNSMIMFCSSMLTGNHDATQLPVVVLGGAGGRLKGGRVLDYLGKPNRKMCSLYLSLLDKAGLHLDEFGDSRQKLAEV